MTHTPLTPETEQKNHPIGIEQLETFDAPQPSPIIRFEIPEFTSLCPKTGQPDFANIVIWYRPKARCVELKSLKMWIWSFRDVGAFHEKLARDMSEALGSKLEPEWLLLEANFWVRGGIHTVAYGLYGKPPPDLLVQRLSRTDYRGY